MRTVITTSFAWCELKHRQKNRHAGFSQIIVDLKNDGAKGAAIRNMAGGEDFNEVVFDNVLVPKDRIVGEPGNGWQQVTSELAYERSGPERFCRLFGYSSSWCVFVAKRRLHIRQRPSAESPLIL